MKLIHCDREWNDDCKFCGVCGRVIEIDPLVLMLQRSRKNKASAELSAQTAKARLDADTTPGAARRNLLGTYTRFANAAAREAKCIDRLIEILKKEGIEIPPMPSSSDNEEHQEVPTHKSKHNGKVSAETTHKQQPVAK